MALQATKSSSQKDLTVSTNGKKIGPDFLSTQWAATTLGFITHSSWLWFNILILWKFNDSMWPNWCKFVVQIGLFQLLLHRPLMLGQAFHFLHLTSFLCRPVLLSRRKRRGVIVIVPHCWQTEVVHHWHMDVHHQYSHRYSLNDRGHHQHRDHEPALCPLSTAVSLMSWRTTLDTKHLITQHVSVNLPHMTKGQITCHPSHLILLCWLLQDKLRSVEHGVCPILCHRSYDNFVVRCRMSNFRYHGNKGRSEDNFKDTVKLADAENHWSCARTCDVTVTHADLWLI